jgi:ubiquinone/menaquinone biosynthesis C-methylase UbiE
LASAQLAAAADPPSIPLHRMWYDIFSYVYDRALEDLYAPYRLASVEALQVSCGAVVLDLPCGTGQSLDHLRHAVGPAGKVLGVDRSAGMLRRARRRVQREGWSNVVLHQSPAEDLDGARVATILDEPHVDGILCALGLTALPDWEATFAMLFALLRPGGRFVLFDVFASERTRQTRSVELVARADLSRQAWRPLEANCSDFLREVLPADPKIFGGELYIASGSRGA